MANVKPPVILDASLNVEDWPVPLESFQAVFLVNIIHVIPVCFALMPMLNTQWEAVVTMIRGISKVLVQGGMSFMYGPVTINGAFKGIHDQAFSDRLKEECENLLGKLMHRNPAFGIRDLSDIIQVAASHGLQFIEQDDMPAHETTIVFRKM